MQWSDLRLAWDPAEFGGITQTQMRAAAITIDQDSDIWLPDIQPYNAGEAVASTLEPSVALVFSDGRVYWSRPGILDVLCKFRGLNAFPFHRELRCPIDVGGWMLSGTFQGISLLDGGSTVYDAVANEDSSGSSCAARSSVARSWLTVDRAHSQTPPLIASTTGTPSGTWATSRRSCARSPTRAARTSRGPSSHTTCGSRANRPSSYAAPVHTKSAAVRGGVRMHATRARRSTITTFSCLRSCSRSSRCSPPSCRPTRESASASA